MATSSNAAAADELDGQIAKPTTFMEQSLETTLRLEDENSSSNVSEEVDLGEGRRTRPSLFDFGAVTIDIETYEFVGRWFLLPILAALYMVPLFSYIAYAQGFEKVVSQTRGRDRQQEIDSFWQPDVYTPCYDDSENASSCGLVFLRVVFFSLMAVVQFYLLIMYFRGYYYTSFAEDITRDQLSVHHIPIPPTPKRTNLMKMFSSKSPAASSSDSNKNHNNNKIKQEQDYLPPCAPTLEPIGEQQEEGAVGGLHRTNSEEERVFRHGEKRLATQGSDLGDRNYGSVYDEDSSSFNPQDDQSRWSATSSYKNPASSAESVQSGTRSKIKRIDSTLSSTSASSKKKQFGKRNTRDILRFLDETETPLKKNLANKMPKFVPKSCFLFKI